MEKYGHLRRRIVQFLTSVRWMRLALTSWISRISTSCLPLPCHLPGPCPRMRCAAARQRMVKHGQAWWMSSMIVFCCCFFVVVSSTQPSIFMASLLYRYWLILFFLLNEMTQPKVLLPWNESQWWKGGLSVLEMPSSDKNVSSLNSFQQKNWLWG